MATYSENVLRDGTITLEELTRCIAASPTVLAADDHISLRLIAYPSSDGIWIPFASQIRVGMPSAADTEELWRQLGQLLLLNFTGFADTIATVEALNAFLTDWPSAIRRGSVAVRGLQKWVRVSRRPSSTLGDHPPHWVATLTYADPATPGPLPTGPFFDYRTRMYASSVADAAVQWLNDPNLLQFGAPRQDLDVIVYDPRVVITATSYSEGAVEVTLETKINHPLYVSLRITDYEGTVRHLSAEAMRSGRTALAVIKVPGPFRNIEGHVFNRDGLAFDSFIENEGRPSARGISLFGYTNEQGDNDAALQRVLDRGEDEHNEVKAFLPIDRTDGKSLELLKTVCAFANTHGGTLYIGVSDNLEVLGVSKALYNGRVTQGVPLKQLHIDYARDLQKLIRNGVTPTPEVDVEWIIHAGHSVCRVSVRRTKGVLHSLVESGDTYVRRGASSRKARAEDFRGLLLPNTRA